jgi:hypothetical protein
MTWEEPQRWVEQMSREEQVRLLQLISALLAQEPPPAAEPEATDDPLDRLTGFCEGPEDWADRHDDYSYGPPSPAS